MPRERGKSEKFQCPECNNVQLIDKNAHRSIRCLSCETAYAIVRDDEGNKVLAPFFNQGSQGSQASEA